MPGVSMILMLDLSFSTVRNQLRLAEDSQSDKDSSTGRTVRCRHVNPVEFVQSPLCGCDGRFSARCPAVNDFSKLTYLMRLLNGAFVP